MPIPGQLRMCWVCVICFLEVDSEGVLEDESILSVGETVVPLGRGSPNSRWAWPHYHCETPLSQHDHLSASAGRWSQPEPVVPESLGNMASCLHRTSLHLPDALVTPRCLRLLVPGNAMPQRMRTRGESYTFSPHVLPKDLLLLLFLIVETIGVENPDIED